jgi:hypothetical protein
MVNEIVSVHVSGWQSSASFGPSSHSSASADRTPAFSGEVDADEDIQVSGRFTTCWNYLHTLVRQSPICRMPKWRNPNCPHQNVRINVRKNCRHQNVESRM